MTRALEGGEGSASRPGRSLPPGKTRYPLYKRLGIDLRIGRKMATFQLFFQLGRTKELPAPLSVEWLVFLLRIEEVPGLNIGPKTVFPDGFLHVCPRMSRKTQVKCIIVVWTIKAQYDIL